MIADTSLNGTQDLRKNSHNAVIKVEHKKIGMTPFFSVSIAGCDLMGSCLYTAGVCASNSGKVCNFLNKINILLSYCV